MPAKFLALATCAAILLCAGGGCRFFVAFYFNDTVIINQTGTLAHHVVDKVCSVVAMSCDIGSYITAGSMADCAFVIHKAINDIA